MFTVSIPPASNQNVPRGQSLQFTATQDCTLCTGSCPSLPPYSNQTVSLQAGQSWPVNPPPIQNNLVTTLPYNVVLGLNQPCSPQGANQTPSVIHIGS